MENFWPSGRWTRMRTSWQLFHMFPPCFHWLRTILHYIALVAKVANCTIFHSFGHLCWFSRHLKFAVHCELSGFQHELSSARRQWPQRDVKKGQGRTEFAKYIFRLTFLQIQRRVCIVILKYLNLAKPTKPLTKNRKNHLAILKLWAEQVEFSCSNRKPQQKAQNTRKTKIKEKLR